MLPIADRPGDARPAVHVFPAWQTTRAANPQEAIQYRRIVVLAISSRDDLEQAANTQHRDAAISKALRAWRCV